MTKATRPRRKKLTLRQTAHTLRMTVKLVRWFTQNDVCGSNRLHARGNPPRFDKARVQAFDKALRGRWPNRTVPAEIKRELRKEARGKCGLCEAASDHLDEAHIRRKGREITFYSQHPSNLILLCPNCHRRYDSDRSRIDVATIVHAKKTLVSRLMESIDRDVRLEKAIRKQVRQLTSAGVGFSSAAAAIISTATGKKTKAVTPLGSVKALLKAADALSDDTPLAAGLVLGLAVEGELDEDLDAFRYIDSLAQPLPTQEEFQSELYDYEPGDEHVPSAKLIAWAAHAGAAYECGICPKICIEPEVLADALTEHWKALEENRETTDEDDDEREPFDEDVVRDETFDDIVNSGVECGDMLGESGACSYHAYVLAKD